MNTHRNIIFYLSIVFLVILGAAAVAAPLLAPYDPTTQNLDQRFKPSSAKHILGTDNFGRDIFSRVIFGSRSALLVGIVAVSIAVIIGTIVGLTAGLSRSYIDNMLMLLMDSLLSFPTILLAITVVSFLGYGLLQVMLAIGIIFSPVFARLVRAETLAIKSEAYVEASRSLGSHIVKIVWKHILPNLLGKVIVQGSISFALTVVIEASLSYLGLGSQPPEPSWGLMLKDARNYLVQAPWMAIYPGLALALTVLCFNLLGDTLSEKLNPKL
ncbi:MAG: ABC transporter permease [Desulfobacterales bacterium]|jgi:ABC-type dipeptide/oligopeptide/nickel transport system permease subunit